MKLTRNQMTGIIVFGVGMVFLAFITYLSVRGERAQGDAFEYGDKILMDSTPSDYAPLRIPPPKIKAFYPIDFHLLKNLDRSVLRNAFYGNFPTGSADAIQGKFKVTGASHIEKPFEGVIIRLEPIQAPFAHPEKSSQREWEIFWYLPLKGNANGELRQAIADATSPEVRFGLDDCLAIIDVSPKAMWRPGIIHVFSPRMTVLAFQNKTYKLDLPDPAASTKETASPSQGAFIHQETHLNFLSGLKLWLKADEGVTSDANGKVSRWEDQSDHGNHATQSISYNQPMLVKNGIAGYPVVRFSGNYLTIPDSPCLHPNHFTIFGIVKENSRATYQTVLSREYRIAGSWYAPYVTFTVGTFGVNQSNYVRSTVSIVGRGHIQANNDNVYDITLPHLFAWKFDGLNQYLYLDSGLVGTQSSPGELDYSGGTTIFTIGSRSDSAPGEYLFGDVAEILLYDTALCDTDKAQVEQYLADKYGISNSQTTSQNGDGGQLSFPK